jgi:hypothetical protein
VSAPGWYPDPTAGAPPGQLRWFDGRSWTSDVHPPVTAPAVSSTHVLEAPEIAVGIPAQTAVGTRVFELTDGGGARLGRLVETTRGAAGGLGIALSRAGAWQATTTREVRDTRGWPQVVLTTSPVLAGSMVVTLPDRREVGRLVLDEVGTWALVGYDGRRWGQVLAGRSVVSYDDRLVATLSESGVGATSGWRVTREPVEEPLRLLGLAASMAADAYGS